MTTAALTRYIAERATALTLDGVQVWHTSMDRLPVDLGELERLLSPDERDRPFRFQPHRDQFAARRGLLRLILGAYLDVPPAHIAFRYNTRGKPQIDSARGASLDFSLSSSDAVIVYAVSRDQRVGIDVERVRPLADFDALAAAFLSPHERAALAALPPGNRLSAFFNGWARKEAYLKATGEGLSIPPDRVEVTLDAPARLLSIMGDTGAASRWHMSALDLAAGYAAALVVEGARQSVKIPLFAL